MVVNVFRAIENRIRFILILLLEVNKFSRNAAAVKCVENVKLEINSTKW